MWNTNRSCPENALFRLLFASKRAKVKKLSLSYLVIPYVRFEWDAEDMVG